MMDNPFSTVYEIITGLTCRYPLDYQVFWKLENACITSLFMDAIPYGFSRVHLHAARLLERIGIDFYLNKVAVCMNDLPSH